jgi:alanyl-tRNA synthetase
MNKMMHGGDPPSKTDPNRDGMPQRFLFGDLWVMVHGNRAYSPIFAETVPTLETEAVMKKQVDPCMHSAEHILNQAMGRLFDCDRCFSAHIERKKSKCDYRFDRPLTDEELKLLENEVNGVIEADLKVSERQIPIDSARKAYNLSRLPGDAGDRIRIVRVGDYDHCPCIGPHVSSTREIGTFQISSSGYKNGVLRIRFKLKRPTDIPVRR